MTTAERHPQLARRNTFQRMLDVERKSKLNRMQAIPPLPSSRTSIGQGRPSISNLDAKVNMEQHRPVMLNTTGRAMTTPNLAVSIPSVQPPNGTTKYSISARGNVIPVVNNEDGGDNSDASSICQSPGWEDYNGKKRKQDKKEKEKKRKEEERVEKERKKLEIAAKKLSKKHPPPANSQRLSRMAEAMDRSASMPAVTSLNEVQKPAEEPKAMKDRSRRGSIEIGIRNFISAGKAIPTPWKSLQTAPSTPTKETPTVAAPTPSLPTTAGGFIGGLKLRQSEEAETQEIIRKVKTASLGDAKGPVDSDSNIPKTIENGSRRTSIAETMTRATSAYEESIRTPYQWDTIYAEAARLANLPDDKIVDENVPMMERNIRKGHKTHPPTSKYFDAEEGRVNKRDSSSGSIPSSSRSGVHSSDSNNQGGVPSAPPANMNLVSNPDVSVKTPEPLEEPPPLLESREAIRGWTSSSYVHHSRQQSQEKDITSFQQDYPVSKTGLQRRSESRSKSIFNRSKSRARDGSRSIDATSTSRPGSNLNTTGPSRAENHLLDDPASKLHLGQMTSSPTETTFSRRRKSSFSASGGLKGLRTAAKAAFSSASAIDSGFESYQSSAEIQVATSRPQVHKRAATTDIATLRQPPPSKSERILGESLPPMVPQDLSPPPKSGRRNGLAGRQVNDDPQPPSSSSHKSLAHQRAQSRSFTSSSEDYSTPDEYSNITTPTVSRPHSEKGQFPPVIQPQSKSTGNLLNQERAPSISTSQVKSNSTGSLLNYESAMMTGAVPFEEGKSGRESWCRTAIPLELTEDEDRLKTPTDKQQTTDHITPKPSSRPPPPISTSTDDLNRRPSLSRSTSTPELQDLSFLPALKHQALTKPEKKEKSRMRRFKQKTSSDSSSSSSSRSSTKEDPPPLPLTKSEGSSPISPTLPNNSPASSTYLQNARLALPPLRPNHPNFSSHSLPRSSKSPFTHHPNTSSQGPDPIAKMFVVCCSCKYFHDMPSKIYECMAKPDNLVEDRDLGVSGLISTSVKCPWCGHGISTGCCAGYAAVVYLREKLH